MEIGDRMLDASMAGENVDAMYIYAVGEARVQKKNNALTLVNRLRVKDVVQHCGLIESAGYGTQLPLCQTGYVLR